VAPTAHILTGPQGAIGPAGQAGSQIYSGTGTPFDLKGAAGATGSTGAAGSQIYAGATVPAPGLGVAGDYYLDKTTYMLYGPKTANGWGTPVLLQGPQGPMGNANVMVDTFSLVSSQYAWNSFYGFETASLASTSFLTRYHDCPFPAVTSGVLATGMVLAYFTSDGYSYPDQWVPLPYSFPAFSDQYYYNFAYQTNVGTVRIQYFYSPNGANGTLPTTLSTDVIATHRFKLVAVSGQIADAMRQANVNLEDEAAVRRFLLQ
jgi:hypothetical protein